MEFDIADLSVEETYTYLTHLVAPRPIALVSTISRDGAVNLSPFSFFNVFSSNPPIVIFSPLLRMKDGTRKHTLHNVMEVPEVVINIVSRDMVGQISLASAEYGEGVDEFVKAGFNKQRARRVRPPMVREARAKLECEVIEIKPLGTRAGAGNLVICKVVHMHINDEIYAEEGIFDSLKLDAVARMGGPYYSALDSENLFFLPKPQTRVGMGMDALPAFIRQSDWLTGNELSVLATVEKQPGADARYRNEKLEGICQSTTGARRREMLVAYAKELLKAGKISDAWQVLLRLETCNKVEGSDGQLVG
jgi:flavin reductase (DIM6/NTAB) family NADH-FMN oxidoreductase RutF